MKERKLIFLKRFLVLFGVCFMSLLLVQVRTTAEEALIPEEGMAFEKEDPSLPDTPSKEEQADFDSSLDFDFSEDPFKEKSDEMPECISPASEKGCFPETDLFLETEPLEVVIKESKETESYEEIEEETLEETREKAVSLPDLKGQGVFPLPFKELTGFLVTWTNPDNETIFWNDRGNTGGSVDGISGSYTLKIEIICGEDCMALTPGNIYTHQLDWPGGNETCVIYPDHADIVYTEPKTGREVYIGSWTLNEEGLLTLVLEDSEEAANTNRWEGYFSVQVFVSSAFDQPAQNAAVKKESLYDPASQSITWTIKADIPAYAGSGIFSSWHLDDDIMAALGTVLINDMADVSVVVSSGRYTGKIPAFQDAAEDCPVAYALEDLGTQKERLVFLSPCSCNAENCRNFSDACLNTYGTGADGRLWCSCWDYRYNAAFTITYSVDVSPVLQDLANLNFEIGTLVMNNVGLWKDKKDSLSFSTLDSLESIIKKEEIRLPGMDNDYTPSYRITVNPAGEDYRSAEYLTITDTMTNLSLASKTLTVMTGGGDMLKQMSDDEIALLSREGNEDRYYSLEVSKVKDSLDGMPKQVLLIRIWYPTNRTYSITYDALVVDPEMGRNGSYLNEAVLGDVCVSTKGQGSWEAGEWNGMSNAVTLRKVDEDQKDQGLSGAEFEVWQYCKDGEDSLITTLTTGEDGRAVFKTDRRAGYSVKCNTLYYFKENLSPEGYLCGEDKIWFYLQEAGTALIPDKEMPAELLDDTGTLREDANLYVGEVPENGTGTLFLEIGNIKEPSGEVLLPETGGPGRNPGTALAIILLFSATALYFSDRKI